MILAQPLLSQSLSENKAREWANEGDAPKAAFTPVTSWLIGPEHPWVPIQKSKEESESCTFTRTKDLIASFHSIATQEPGYSFVPGTRLDDGLVEGVAPKEATEVTGLPHLVNYVVSRVGSDLGQLSAAKSEPGVNQASLERWLDSALLEEVSTVKSEQPDSTNQKRDERARSADTGAKSNLLDRLEVGMCRICRQQVRSTKPSSQD